MSRKKSLVLLALGAGGLTSSAYAEPASGGGEGAGVERCEDVAPIESDVVGTATVGFVDPIFLGAVNSYANEHPDVFGGLWIDRDAGGTLVVAFTDEPEPHRDALAARRPKPTDDVGMSPPPSIVDDRPLGEWDQAFDVVQVEFSRRQLDTTQQALGEWFDQHDIARLSTAPDLQRNRVAVELHPDNADALQRLDSDVPAEQLCDRTEALHPSQQYQPGDPLDVIAPLDADGLPPADTSVSCDGGRPTFPIGTLTELEPDTAAARPDISAAVDTLWAEVFPHDNWSILHETDITVELIRLDGDNAAFVTLKKTDAGLVMEGGSGSGPCTLRTTLPPGLNVVEWTLDPEGPPAADSTVIDLLATERNCASGQPMGDRLLGPQIVENDTEIRIAFAAISLIGSQTCPSNPSQPIAVQLSEPVGTRVINDGTIITTRLSDITG